MLSSSWSVRGQLGGRRDALDGRAERPLELSQSERLDQVGERPQAAERLEVRIDAGADDRQLAVPPAQALGRSPRRRVGGLHEEHVDVPVREDLTAPPRREDRLVPETLDDVPQQGADLGVGLHHENPHGLTIGRDGADHGGIW